MVPTTTVLGFTFHGNLALAGTVAGLLVGLVLFLMLGGACSRRSRLHLGFDMHP